MTLVEKIGQCYRKQALRNQNSLALFSNIEVNPQPDEKNERSIINEIKMKELGKKLVEVSTECSIVSRRGGHLNLVFVASLQLGGTITFEHQNLQGINRSLTASMTTSSFLKSHIIHGTELSV
ncbi:protein TOC75, chloroplastic-like isoform X2 [Vicia villosa]|uniref:protein TOC75, chloroplastic-like isoform X2 n=1 Tax=Vicia villosa TaxID=3911 RepID=UPI00273C54F9|nr:protein TOC75, chloroplastic-like isoform X2 [Vicia villosa]